MCRHFIVTMLICRAIMQIAFQICRGRSAPAFGGTSFPGASILHGFDLDRLDPCDPAAGPSGGAGPSMRALKAALPLAVGREVHDARPDLGLPANAPGERPPPIRPP